MKKLTLIILTFCLFITTSAYAVEYGKELENMPERTYEQTFSDVPTTHWAFEYISELVNDKVLSGYPDGQFRPNNNVTRAEFAKIMISASGIQVRPATATSFEDVAITDWYCPYIESAKEFLTGFQYGGSAMYLPTKAAIREDIAVALVKLKGYDVSVADLGMIQTMFSDYDSISESAKRYVAVAVERGLVSGYDDGTFRGQKSITRAEAATLIWRANQYGSDNKILGSDTTEIVSTPMPVQTHAPTPEPTVEPIPEPTPTPKPYKIDKLADAKITDNSLTTLYNNSIYYADELNCCIYKIDTTTGESEVYCDTSDLILGESQNNNVVEYSNYKPVQVYYDKTNSKLLMIGVYQTSTVPFCTPENIELTVIYDITEDIELYSKTGIDYEISYVGSFNSQKGLMRNPNYQYDLDIEQGKAILDMRRNGRPNCGSMIISNNNVYILSGGEFWEKGIFLMKYSFNEDDFEIISNPDYSAYAIGTESYYFYKNDIFYELDIVTGKYKELEINTLEENVENLDMSAIRENIDARFYVIDDDTIIFYDKSMKAFRKLEKNI